MSGRPAKRIAALTIAGTLGSATVLLAQNAPRLELPLRGPTPLDQIAPAPRMTPMRNTSEREVRNYPEQPPVIPHSIEGYQIDLNGNKCLVGKRCGRAQSMMRATGSSKLSRNCIRARGGSCLSKASTIRTHLRK